MRAEGQGRTPPRGSLMMAETGDRWHGRAICTSTDERCTGECVTRTPVGLVIVGWIVWLALWAALVWAASR